MGEGLSRNMDFFTWTWRSGPLRSQNTTGINGILMLFSKMLDTYGANIVLTWGFPPNCLQLVSRMKTAGIVTIWIDAPLLFLQVTLAPRSWTGRSHFYLSNNSHYERMAATDSFSPGLRG